MKWKDYFCRIYIYIITETEGNARETIVRCHEIDHCCLKQKYLLESEPVPNLNIEKEKSVRNFQKYIKKSIEERGMLEI